MFYFFFLYCLLVLGLHCISLRIIGSTNLYAWSSESKLICVMGKAVLLMLCKVICRNAPRDMLGQEYQGGMQKLYGNISIWTSCQLYKRALFWKTDGLPYRTKVFIGINVREIRYCQNRKRFKPAKSISQQMLLACKQHQSDLTFC